MTAPAIIQMDEAGLKRIRHEMLYAVTEPAVFRVEGPGALECLQGLLTCDVVAPGSESVMYGALLTVKGMIAVDFVVLRDSSGFTLITDSAARVSALDLFRRQLPPRLARLTDRTGSQRVLWMLGAQAERVTQGAGLPWPTAVGKLNPIPSDHGPALLGRPHSAAPWSGIVSGSVEAIDAVADRLGRAGANATDSTALEAARILAGWPALGREIDQKTLPQEVRYDELDGVSYTKGCYVGQETVARVHFRGHVNRQLWGLRWQGATAPASLDVTYDGKMVGRLTSGIQLEGRGIGLGVLRREVLIDSKVRIGAIDCLVASLPFEPKKAEAPGVQPGASPRQ